MAQLGSTIIYGGLKVISDIETNKDIILNDKLIKQEDLDTYLQFHEDNQCRIVTGGDERIEINNDGIKLNNTGATINEFSTDTTLAGNSDTAVPTEKAVKTYVDSKTITTIDGGTF